MRKVSIRIFNSDQEYEHWRINPVKQISLILKNSHQAIERGGASTQIILFHSIFREKEKG